MKETTGRKRSRERRRRDLPAIDVRVCETPRPFGDVLDALADLLIDMADADGSLSIDGGSTRDAA